MTEGLPRVHLYHDLLAHLVETDRPRDWAAYATNSGKSEDFADENDLIVLKHKTWMDARSDKWWKRYPALLLIAHELGHCEGKGHMSPEKHGMLAAMLDCVYGQKLGIMAYHGNLRIFATPGHLYRKAKYLVRNASVEVMDRAKTGA